MRPVPISIILVVIFVAGAFFLNNWQRRGPAVSFSSEPSPSPSTTGDPTASSYAPTTWKQWTDTNYSKTTGISTSYSLAFPRDFDVFSGERAGGASFVGKPRLNLRFPQDAFQNPKSNYVEAYVTLSIGEDTASVANCYADPASVTKMLLSSQTINGITFRTGETSDVGAGQLYHTKIFRTLFNNNCYELGQTVHTGNIQNYPEDTVVQFDENAAFTILHQIIGTFSLATSTQAAQ
jgi:hypothetical protein